jgi:hypothetical protein
MNREKWAKMIHEERNIKVAELSGWRRVEHEDGSQMWQHASFPNLPYPNRVYRLPDYENDLNAMHGAVCTMSRKQRTRWAALLSCAVLGPEMPGDWNGEWNQHQLGLIANATAAQRAEAFALTMEPE